jgi:hypothetical protein
MDLRAIAFDTLGALVDPRSGLTDGLGAWGAERGLSANWSGLADAWRDAYQISMSEVRTGKKPWQDWDAVAASVECLAEPLGCYP